MTRGPGNGGHGIQARNGYSPTSTPSKQGRGVPEQKKLRRGKHATPSPAQRILFRHKSPNTIKCTYVLDTNVLMHDPTALFRFKEHDVFLAQKVLEELDDNKKGLTEVARNTRQTLRFLDTLTKEKTGADILAGISLVPPEHLARELSPTGKIFFETGAHGRAGNQGERPKRADDEILEACFTLQDMAQDKRGKEVILVSKDVNFRIRAVTNGIPAEDYLSDTTIEDVDVLHSGVHVFGKELWEENAGTLEAKARGTTTEYHLKRNTVDNVCVNEIISVRDNAKPLDLIVCERSRSSVRARMLTDYRKKDVWGVTARNDEQNYALNLLMDPEVHFVSLLGPAGTGKTLLTLAAGLEQVFENRKYKEIIVTRATVPVGEDIGFLPGTEAEKMSPWMGALWDNLEVLGGKHLPAERKKGSRDDKPDADGEWGRTATQSVLMERIKIRSLNFMRGRTLLERYLVLDEAQNLTPKQMKTLVTRAGPGTKIVCLGNLKQIDSPYLNETSSGLGYVVERFRGWEHSAHITLSQIERSPLAEYAEMHL